MKTYIIKRPDYEWVEALTITWDSLESYFNHLTQVYKNIPIQFKSEIKELKNNLKSSFGKSEKYKARFACKNFIDVTITPYLRDMDIDVHWFYSLRCIWNDTVDLNCFVEYNISNFGELIVEFESDLPRGIIKIC